MVVIQLAKCIGLMIFNRIGLQDTILITQNLFTILITQNLFTINTLETISCRDIADIGSWMLY